MIYTTRSYGERKTEKSSLCFSHRVYKNLEHFTSLMLPPRFFINKWLNAIELLSYRLYYIIVWYYFTYAYDGGIYMKFTKILGYLLLISIFLLPSIGITAPIRGNYNSPRLPTQPDIFRPQIPNHNPQFTPPMIPIKSPQLANIQDRQSWENLQNRLSKTSEELYKEQMSVMDSRSRSTIERLNAEAKRDAEMWDRQMKQLQEQQERILRDQREYIEMQDKLNRIFSTSPKSSSDYNDLGFAYASLGKSEEAITHYKQSIELNPSSAVAYYNRGIEYLRNSQYLLAINDFTSALQLDPTFMNAYANRAAAYIVIGAYKKGVEDYNIYLVSNPDDASAYSNRAAGYYHLGDRENAFLDYMNALRLNPNNHVVYFNRAQAYASYEKYNEALNDYNHSIRLNPRNSDALNGRAIVLSELGRSKEAFDDFNLAIRIDPNNATLYLNRAITMSNVAENDKAIADINHSLALRPENIIAYYYKGVIAERGERIEIAREGYRKFVEAAIGPKWKDKVDYSKRRLLALSKVK